VSHAYVPTAFVLKDRIRVFAAFWDADRRGRLGYIDVDQDNPERVYGVSSTPVLPDPLPGHFDSDGVTPLCITNVGGEIRLYYAGWRRLEGRGTRYTLFTGLAISDDGAHFRRHQDDPIIGPGQSDSTVRTGGFVMRDGDQWRCWFADFVENINVNGKVTPSYRLATMESPDGLNWPAQSSEVFPTIRGQIFGYGRSAVWKDNGRYKGLFSVRRNEGGYRSIEYAESDDGCEWSPFDAGGMSFPGSATVDGQSQVAFPSLIFQDRRILMFYNGDGFGRDGLRAAIWS